MWLTKPADELGVVPRRQLGVVEAMGTTVTIAIGGVDLPAATNRHHAPVLSLVLPKTGPIASAAAEQVGELCLADISVPPCTLPLASPWASYSRGATSFG